ncbi:hypothetical protein ACK8N7_01850 [Streptomyces griseobrunneus]|uniref:hypothetical protein n=1 Tax=Streptomyces microflavus TaxID=1919 RepID=UPI00381FD4BD
MPSRATTTPGRATRGSEPRRGPARTVPHGRRPRRAGSRGEVAGARAVCCARGGGRSITDAQAKGLVDPEVPAAEVLSLVTAMSMTWSPAGVMVTASKDEAEVEHDRRRTALARAGRRAFAP